MSQIVKGRKMRYTTIHTLTDNGWQQEIVANQPSESRNYRDAWCECPESLRESCPIFNHHSNRYDTVCSRCRKFIAVG